MTWTPIDLAAGLRSDDTPFAASGTFRDASNIRFRQGRAEVIPGWERFIVAELPGVVRNVHAWKDTQGSSLVAMGSTSNLLLQRGGVMTDITPTGLAPGRESTAVGPGFGIGEFGRGAYGRSQEGIYFARTWSLANYGVDLLVNPRGGGLYRWSSANPAQVAQPVQNAPSVAGYMLVTPQRQVLMFGAPEVDSGQFNPMCIRVSNTEDPTSWIPTSLNNADEIIVEGSGRLIGARLFGPGFVCWTESRCFVGSFVGSTTQSYAVTELFGAGGMLGPNASCNTGGSLFWLTPDLRLQKLDIGATATSIVDIPISADTLAHVSTSQGDKVSLGYTRQNNELRIDYPDQRDGRECSRYLVLNLTDGSWSKGLQARSAYDAGLTNPIGMQPKLNKQINTALAYDFRANALNGVTVSNSTISGGLDGATWACGSANSHLFIPNQSISGNAFRYIAVDVQRLTARASGAWRGVAYYSTANHSESDNYRSQAENDLAVGERRTLLWDMSNLALGGNDWINGVANEIRLDLDNGPGGTFVVHSIKVYGDPVAAPSTTVALYHERGTNADGSTLSWFLETNYFALDEDETRVLVRGMKPDFKGLQGLVNLTLYLSDEMNDGLPETVVGPFPLQSTGKADFFASGKLCRFRLDGYGAPAAGRLGRPLFDHTPMGNR